MENSNLTGKTNCNIYKGLEFSNVMFTNLKFVIIVPLGQQVGATIYVMSG